MYAAERHFVTTAKAQLRLLAQNLSAQHLANTHTQTEACLHRDIQTSIHTIKLAASPVKARAVYRAALLCEDTLKRYPVSSPKFHTSLNGLKSLVGLYTEGLLEIDPDFKTILLDGTLISKNVEDQTQETDYDELQDELLAANENAVNTLKPLLKLVNKDRRLNALSFLTSYGQDGEQKPTDAKPVQPSIRFEALMRQITNRTLGQARAIGKDISISYASEFDVIEKKTALVLQAFLENACLQILKTGLPNNLSGQKRTWQISLTGSRKAQKLAIALTWPGYALGQALSQTPSNYQSFQALGGTIKSKTKKHADRDSINGLDTGLDIQLLEIICPATLQVPVTPNTQSLMTPQITPHQSTKRKA